MLGGLSLSDSTAFGVFLVCIRLRSLTVRGASIMVDITKQGTAIQTPEPVFRTRHVNRQIWSVKDWTTGALYNSSTDETTITWGWYYPSNALQSLYANATTYDAYFWWMPAQRWASPFAKPKNWATESAVISGGGIVGTAIVPGRVIGTNYLDTAFSTATADRYAATSVVVSEPEPIFFTCLLAEGQFLVVEEKYYEEDALKVSATTPTLIDTIPTTTGPSGSEVEVTISGSAIADMWMLRI